MKTLKRLLAIISFVFVIMGGYNQKAQAQVHLTIDSLINFPDTAVIGQAYPIAIRVKNIGNQPFQGPLQIGLMQDSAFTYLYYSNNPANVIFPNDTLTFYTTNGMLGFVFDSTVFRPGNNVVVVWPYANQSGVIIDSITTNVYVNYTTAIRTLFYEGIEMYPNPFRNEMVFSGAGSENIDRVRIFTLQGVKVYDEKFIKQVLNSDQLLSGCYLMEVLTKEGTHFYKKIIKE